MEAQGVGKRRVPAPKGPSVGYRTPEAAGSPWQKLEKGSNMARSKSSVGEPRPMQMRRQGRSQPVSCGGDGGDRQRWTSQGQWGDALGVGTEVAGGDKVVPQPFPGATGWPMCSLGCPGRCYSSDLRSAPNTLGPGGGWVRSVALEF